MFDGMVDRVCERGNALENTMACMQARAVAAGPAYGLVMAYIVMAYAVMAYAVMA